MDNFLKHSVDTDVIVYFGHGYDDGGGWSWGRDPDLTTNTIDSYNVDFGNTKPFVFALADLRYPITNLSMSTRRRNLPKYQEDGFQI